MDFAGDKTPVGLCIIIGSNLDNIAIIRGIAAFATLVQRGSHCKLLKASNVGTVALAGV